MSGTSDGDQPQQTNRESRLAAAQVRRRRLIEEREDLDSIIQGLRTQLEKAERLRGKLTEDISLATTEIYDLEHDLGDQVPALSSEQNAPRILPRSTDGRFYKLHETQDAKKEAKRLSQQRWRAKSKQMEGSESSTRAASPPAENQPSAECPFSPEDFKDCLPPEIEKNSTCLVCQTTFTKRKGSKVKNLDSDGQNWWVCRYCGQAIEEKCMTPDEKAQAVIFTCAACLDDDRGIDFQALKKTRR